MVYPTRHLAGTVAALLSSWITATSYLDVNKMLVHQVIGRGRGHPVQVVGKEEPLCRCQDATFCCRLRSFGMGGIALIRLTYYSQSQRSSVLTMAADDIWPKISSPPSLHYVSRAAAKHKLPGWFLVGICKTVSYRPITHLHMQSYRVDSVCKNPRLQKNAF